MVLKIIITILITLVLLVVTIRNFRLGMYLFIFLCPIIPPVVAIYFNDTIPLITFQRLMLAILSVVWLGKYLTGRWPKVEKPPLIELLLGFVVLVFISSLLSPQPASAMKEFFSERTFGVLIIYFLAFQSFRTEAEIKRVIYFFVMSAVAICLVGIIEELSWKNIFCTMGGYLMPQEKLNALGFDRVIPGPYSFSFRWGIYLVHSSFQIFSALAAYLVFIIPLTPILYARAGRTLIRPGFLVLLIILLCVTLFFTVSLGGYLVVGLTLILIWRVRWPVKVICLIAGIMCVLGFFWSTGIIAKERGAPRFWQVTATLQKVAQRPFTGYGFNTFNTAINVATPDGTFLRKGDGYSYQQNLLLECGIPAFLVMFLFWLIILIRVSRNTALLRLQGAEKLSRWNQALLAALLGNFILSFASVSLLNTTIGFYIFWITAALGMRLWVISRQTRSIPKPLPPTGQNLPGPYIVA